MKKNWIYLFVLVLVISGCTKAFVKENDTLDSGKWKVVTMKNGKGYIQPIAQVKNKFGFILMVSVNGKGEKTVGFVIPSKYHRIASYSAFIKLQVDDYKMQRKTFHMDPEGHSANVYLSEQEIHQIKKGKKLKIKYLREVGWSNTICFELKNSNKTISYIF